MHIHSSNYGHYAEVIPGGVPCAEWNAYIRIIVTWLARDHFLSESEMDEWFLKGKEEKIKLNTTGEYTNSRD